VRVFVALEVVCG